jgi:hypothetical protein
VAVLVVAATGYVAFHTEKQLDSRRAALRAFDASARDAASSLADLRASQQAYVAAGQGVAFWMPKVAALIETAEQSVDTLRTTAETADARSALMDAAASISEFKNVDKRARDYLKSSQSLMAADVVFTEGGETAASAAKQVDAAGTAEHLDFDRFEARQKKAELYDIAGGAAFGVLMLVLLAATGSESTAAADSAETITLAHAAAPAADPAPAPTAAAERASVPALRAAAALCTEFGCMRDVNDLTRLLGRAADAMEASGIVVWLGTATGGDLRPVVAHGYAPELLARMPALPRSANNAAAAAYRTSSLQIVLSRPGGQSGALVAPLLSPDGCIGALTAEIKGGAETSDAVQSLAAIFAAQLAGVLAGAASDAQAPEAPARAASL